MANIIQAGKWLREGKKVRISTRNPNVFVCFQKGNRELLGIFTGPESDDLMVDFVLCVCDIESDLWETFEWVN